MLNKKAIMLSLSSFLLGMAVVAAIPLCRKFIRLKLYTTRHSAELFQKWDKEKLVLNTSDNPLADFLEENEQFVIFFWATWCPYCKMMMDANDILVERGITIIGLPYDNDAEYFTWFVGKYGIGWDNLLRQEYPEGRSFIQRKADFYIPLIPSWWLIENGKVSNIFVGSRGKEKLLTYFREEL